MRLFEPAGRHYARFLYPNGGQIGEADRPYFAAACQSLVEVIDVPASAKALRLGDLGTRVSLLHADFTQVLPDAELVTFRRTRSLDLPVELDLMTSDETSAPLTVCQILDPLEVRDDTIYRGPGTFETAYIFPGYFDGGIHVSQDDRFTPNSLATNGWPAEFVVEDAGLTLY